MWRKWNKQISIKNNTPFTFRIRVIEFSYSQPALKASTKTPEIRQIKMAQEKETLSIRETLLLSQTQHELLGGKRRDYHAMVEIINSHNVVIRKAILFVGDVWEIHSICEEELNRNVAVEIYFELLPKRCRFWFY